jgi:hypothetical protein
VGVDGQFRPYFTVEQGEVFVLRMLMASGTRPLELVQTSGPKCEMKLLARDGVFRPDAVHRHAVCAVPAGAGGRTWPSAARAPAW